MTSTLSLIPGLWSSLAPSSSMTAAPTISLNFVSVLGAGVAHFRTVRRRHAGIRVRICAVRVGTNLVVVRYRRGLGANSCIQIYIQFSRSRVDGKGTDILHQKTRHVLRGWVGFVWLVGLFWYFLE